MEYILKALIFLQSVRLRLSLLLLKEISQTLFLSERIDLSSLELLSNKFLNGLRDRAIERLFFLAKD